MSRISMIIFVLIVGVSTHAQQTETAQVAAYYTFHYVHDTTQPADVLSERYVLFIGNTSSAYKSYDKFLRDSSLRAQFEQQSGSGLPFAIKAPPGITSASPTMFYKYPATNKMSQFELQGKYYQIDDEIPAHNWTITQDTKDIHGVACQKATTHFRGRNYTAWFANSLPYSNGPWKFGGLPGLVLEAEDEKKEIVFSFDAFENIAGRNIQIAPPTNAIPTTIKELKRLREAIANNAQTASSASEETGMKVSRISGPNGGPVKKRVMNNPIEKGN